MQRESDRFKVTFTIGPTLQIELGPIINLNKITLVNDGESDEDRRVHTTQCDSVGGSTSPGADPEGGGGHAHPFCAKFFKKSPKLA